MLQLVTSSLLIEVTIVFSFFASLTCVENWSLNSANVHLFLIFSLSWQYSCEENPEHSVQRIWLLHAVFVTVSSCHMKSFLAHFLMAG
jgi:hypothetical protein